MFISAGCGISPVMSMAQHFLTNPEESAVSTIKFLHCAQDVPHIIFLEDILLLTQQYQNFEAYYLMEEVEPFSLLPNLSQGFITREYLKEIFNDIKDYAVYICGPEPFMMLVQSYLQELGFDMTFFYREQYTIEPSDSLPIKLLQDEIVSVTLPDYDITIPNIKRGTMLLEVLEQANIPIIGTCRKGVCGSCKCRIQKGIVQSKSIATLSDREIMDGYVLACSSRILTDVEVCLK